MHVERMKIMAGSVRKLIRRRAFGHVVNLLEKLRPADISKILLDLIDRDRLAVFSTLMKHDRKLAALALTDLGLESGRLLQSIPPADVAKVLQELETDDRAGFISLLPPETADEVLELMRGEESREVQGLLQYPEETAGRIMTPNVFSLKEELSVSEAISTLQTSSEELEMIFYLYVVDERNHLVGVVSLRQLLTVPPETPLKKVMSGDVIAVRTNTDQEEVARQVALYDLLAIPVVDHQNKLVGMITVDDVIDVIEDEATEDILHLAGVEADEHVHASARTSVRKRLPWLGINLGMALLAATVVAYYEPTIAALPLLAIFLPVVAGMGGNSGTQALTIMVRSLALGEVTWKNSRSVIFKELLVGLTNGTALGVVAGVVAYLWKANMMLGLVLGGALIVNMFLAGFVGALIPLVLKKLGVDPAIASGIFLHTTTDVVGFFSFLGLATLLI